MNGVVSLQKQARELITQVLNEKDVIISSFSKQIVEFQQQISQLSDQIQKGHRQPSDIQEHSIQDLIRENFVSNVQDRFHILLDVSTLIRQNIDNLKIDRKAQIIKEVNNSDADIAYQQLSNAFEKTLQQNRRLTKIMEQKDEQNQAIVNSLKNELKHNKDEYSQAAQQLLQKISILQQQNQMMYLQGKQTETQRISTHFKKDKYQQMHKQNQEKDKTIEKLHQSNERLVKTNKQLNHKVQQMENIIKNNKEQIARLLKKYQQQHQYHPIITQNISSKVQIPQSQYKQQKQDDLFLQSKVKAIQMQCSSLLKQKDKVVQDLVRLKEQNAVLAQKNQLLNKLLSNFPALSHSQHKIQNQDEMFMQQLQSKIKELNSSDQIIINKKQQQSSNKLLNSNIQISVSKIKSKFIKQSDSNTLFVSPAQKDISFPIASTPSQQKQKIRSKQSSKRLIRIGY